MGARGNPQDSARNLTNIVLHEESHLKALRLLEANPCMNQRDLAEALGISLGKTNYCLKALFDKGFIKIQNFRNSQNKLAYAYLLTPDGMVAKADMTTRFLKLKMAEYELLKREIDMLRTESIERSPNDKILGPAGGNRDK